MNQFRFQSPNFENVNAAATNRNGRSDAESDDDDDGDVNGYGKEPAVQFYWLESV